MFDERDLEEAGRRFAIVVPPISEEAINAIFSTPFPGKEDLVQFYLCYNGGSRTPQGCIIACANPAHRVSRDDLIHLRVEGFLSVSVDPED